MARRGEERNAEARAKLEPLETGERPTVPSPSAPSSPAILAIAITASAVIVALAGGRLGERPPRRSDAIFAVVLWAMAWGMWRARYWAVLGFQGLLLIVLASALGLVAVTTIPQLIARLLLLGLGLALLFHGPRAGADPDARPRE